MDNKVINYENVITQSLVISSSDDTPHIFMVSSSSVPILSMYARTPSALPPYTAVTNGLAIKNSVCTQCKGFKDVCAASDATIYKNLNA